MTAKTEIYHVPVLLKESVDGLNIKSGGIYVDVTFGGGSHSREILSRLGGSGHLYSFDQDADAERNIGGGIGATDEEREAAKDGTPEVSGDKDNHAATHADLSLTPNTYHPTPTTQHPTPTNFTFVRSNFRYLKNWMRYYGVDRIDGLLADLGVSSHHFDDETRGFSFRFDAPLDMRMNKCAGQTAADVVNDYTEKQLADVFYLYGELKTARRIAAAIVRARQESPILTTHQFLQVVKPLFKREREKKDMAKLFQALRIEVNREMDALKDMLLAAQKLLAPGGRMSIITYHSLEDRIVKNMIKTGNSEGKVVQDFFGQVESVLRPVNTKVIVPDDAEQAANPRSRSAKLRIAEKK